MGRRGRSQFGDLGFVFFITTTVVNFGKIFGCGSQYYEILLASLKHVRDEHKATLFAFVFMPSHIHLVAGFPVGEHVSDFMRDFKKFISTKVRQQLEQDNQLNWLRTLRRNAKGKKNQLFKLWNDRFDDVVIESEEVMQAKIEYIHQNPVTAGLVATPEEWKYSSASNYATVDGVIEIATNWEYK